MRERFRAAEPLEAALFEHPQKLGLSGDGKRGHFIEHDGSRAGHLQPSQFAFHRARECAAFVTE